MAICRDGDMAPPSRDAMERYELFDSSSQDIAALVSTRPRKGRGSGMGGTASPRVSVDARLGSNWAKEGG